MPKTKQKQIDTTSEATQETMRTVKFVADYFVLTTTVLATDEEQAVANALVELTDYYGKKFVTHLQEFSSYIEVEEEENLVW